MPTSSPIFIFNTRVDMYDKDEVSALIDAYLESHLFHQIATVNPEFLLLSRKNSIFQSVLHQCDLNVPDGFGLHVALWKQRKRLRARIPGANLLYTVLSKAQHKNLTVMCLVRKDGLSSWKRIRKSIKHLYPKLHVRGIEIESYHTIDMLRPELQQSIRETSIVVCNIGAPQQEIFLAGLRHNAGDIRLAMGIGGSFDFITGVLPRAPKWMQVIGIEWLWRLILQPSRFLRVANAVILFPLLILFKSR